MSRTRGLIDVNSLRAKSLIDEELERKRREEAMRYSPPDYVAGGMRQAPSVQPTYTRASAPRVSPEPAPSLSIYDQLRTMAGVQPGSTKPPAVEPIQSQHADIAAARSNVPIPGQSKYKAPDPIKPIQGEGYTTQALGRQVQVPSVPQHKPEDYDKWSTPSRLGYQVARGAAQTLGGELELGVGQKGREAETWAESGASMLGSILPYIAVGQALGVMGASTAIGGAVTKGAGALKVPARIAQTLGKGAELYSSGAILGGSLSAIRQSADPEEKEFGEKLYQVARDANTFGMFRLVMGGVGAPIKQAVSQKIGSISQPMVERALNQSITKGVMTENFSRIVNAVATSIAGSVPSAATIATMNTTLKYLKNPAEFDKDAAANEALSTIAFLAGYDLISSLLGVRFTTSAKMTGQDVIADYYKTLGLKKGASMDEVKKAYRSYAKKYHPDFNPDNPKAADAFMRVNEAYNGIKLAMETNAVKHPAMNKKPDSLIRRLIADERGEIGRERFKPAVVGKTDTTYTERNDPINVKYAVVDLKDITPSHDANFKVNPNFPKELQPRDRSREASDAQVRDIVARFNPARLGANPEAGLGAPMVGSDGVVEIGNARTIALSRIYGENLPQAEQYKQFIMEQAESLGLDPSAIKNISQPVLVRVRESEVPDRTEFVRSGNIGTEAKMSATEVAKLDAQKLTPQILMSFAPNEQGRIDTADNRQFIRNFIEGVVPKSELGTMIDAEGRQITKDGLSRIKNSIFARVYEETTALEKLSEDIDVNVKNQVNAMVNASPSLLRMKDLVERGELYPLDITVDIAQAMVKLSVLRDQKMTVDEYLRQQQLFGEDLSPVGKEMLSIFDRHKRSSTKITEILNEYARLVELAGNPNQMKLFEEADPSKADILQRVLTKVEGRDEEQISLFATQPESGGEVAPVGRTEPTETSGAEVAGAETPREEVGPVKEATSKIGGMEITKRDTGTGTQYIAKVEGKEVGEIVTKQKADGNYEVSNVLVWPEHQGKQYATDLYRLAYSEVNAAGKKLYISDDRTQDAQALHQRFKDKGILRDDGEITFAPAEAPVVEPKGGEPLERQASSERVERDSGEAILKPGSKGRITGLDSRVPIRRVEEGEYGKLITTRGGAPLSERYEHSQTVGEVLTQHQIDGKDLAITAIDKHGGFILADGTGAGKTMQVLAVGDHYARKGQTVLVVVPNRQIINDAYKRDGDMIGVGFRVATDALIPGKINITTYASLDKLKGKKADYIIFDESHSLKNADSKRSQIGVDMAKDAKGAMFVSATPFDKGEHLPYLAKTGIFEVKSHDQIMSDLGYELTTVKVPNGYGGTRTIEIWKPVATIGERNERKEALFNEIADLGLMVKREVSMDKMAVGFWRVELPQEAHEKLEEIEVHYHARYAEGDFMPPLRRAEMLMAQRRFQEHYKVENAFRLAEEEVKAGRQVVIFATRVNETQLKDKIYAFIGGERVLVDEVVLDSSPATLPDLAEKFQKAGIPVAEIFGSGSVDKEVKRFQSGEAKVALVTPEKGGAGLSLDDTVGDAPRTMIVMTPLFSGVDNVQLPGRINRMSTQSDSRTVYMIADTEIDTWNAKIIGEKMQTLKAVVKGELSKLDLSEMEMDMGKVSEQTKPEIAADLTKKDTQPIPTPSPVSEMPTATPRLAQEGIVEGEKGEVVAKEPEIVTPPEQPIEKPPSTEQAPSKIEQPEPVEKPAEVPAPKGKVIDPDKYSEKLSKMTGEQFTQTIKKFAELMDRPDKEKILSNYREIGSKINVEIVIRTKPLIKKMDAERLAGFISYLDKGDHDKAVRDRFPNYKQLINLAENELRSREDKMPVAEFTKGVADAPDTRLEKQADALLSKNTLTEQDREKLDAVTTELGSRDSKLYRVQQTRVHAAVNRLDLTREDKIEIARELFKGKTLESEIEGSELNSTKQLSEKELRKLGDHLIALERGDTRAEFAEAFPETNKKHKKDIDRLTSGTVTDPAEQPITQAEKILAKKAELKEKEYKKKLEILNADYQAGNELHIGVTAKDIEDTYGVKLQPGEDPDKLVAWLWEGPQGDAALPTSKEMTPAEYDKWINKDVNWYQRWLMPIYREHPEDMRWEYGQAMTQVLQEKDKYTKVSNEALKGMTLEQRGKVAAMLDGLIELEGKEGEAAKKLREELYRPLFALGVKSGELQPEQHIEDYYPRIVEYVVGQYGDSEIAGMRLPKPWMTYDREDKLRDYNMDAQEVTRLYINALVKNIYMKPVHEKWRTYVESLPEGSARRAMAEQMIATSMRIPHAEIKLMDNMIRDAYKLFKNTAPDEAPQLTTEFARMLTQMTVQKHMGLSLSTAMRNLTQPLLAMVEVSTPSDPFRGLKAYMMYRRAILTPEGKKFIHTYAALRHNRTFMENLDTHSNTQWKINNLLDKTGKVTMSWFKWADLDNVQAAWFIGFTAGRMDGMDIAESLRRGNSVSLRTQYDYSIGKSAVYHTPIGRLGGIFTSWAGNYAALLSDWGTKDQLHKYLLLLLMSGAVTYLGRKLGFKLNIMPLEIAKGHIFHRVGKSNEHILQSTAKEYQQIYKRLMTGDPEEWLKAAEEAAYQLPAGVMTKRIATLTKAALNDWEVDNGSHSYKITGIAQGVRHLMGMSVDNANRWDMVMWVPERATDTEKNTTGRSLVKTHKAYETALHRALNPNAKVTWHAVRLALTGKGYEVEDLFKSPGAAVEALEDRMLAAGMDIDAAHKQAISNVRTYYAERAKISVMKGKDNWRAQFDEHFSFIIKSQPDKTPAEVKSSRRGSYYNMLEEAITKNNKNLEGRAVWALERLGADRTQINKVMAGRDVRLPTYDYK